MFVSMPSYWSLPDTFSQLCRQPTVWVKHKISLALVTVLCSLQTLPKFCMKILLPANRLGCSCSLSLCIRNCGWGSLSALLYHGCLLVILFFAVPPMVYPGTPPAHLFEPMALYSPLVPPSVELHLVTFESLAITPHDLPMWWCTTSRLYLQHICDMRDAIFLFFG